MTEEERIAAEKAAAEKAAADKIAADKIAAEKAAADKIAADKVAAEAAAAEELKKKLSGMSDEAAALLKEQMATKAKLKAEKEAREALETKLKAFEGIDPEKIKALLEADAKAAADKIEADKKALEKAGEFDRLKGMMAEEHKKDKTQLTEVITTTKTALDSAMQTIANLTVGQAFSNSQFITDELVLTPRIARDVYGSHFETENDGTVVGYDKPRGAQNRTKLVNSSGEALKFDEAVKKLVDAAPDKDQILKSKLKTGASSSTTNSKVVKSSNSENNGGELRGAARIAAALSKGAFKKTK